MPEDTTPVEQPEVVEKKPKAKKKKRKKKAKAEKQDDTSSVLEALESVATTLGTLTERMNKIEEAAVLDSSGQIVARGPGAPTANQRANQELGYQIPGPARQEQSPAERDKARRDAIYADRERRGRVDRETMPSGVVASVGNRQRRDPGASFTVNRAQ